MSSARPETAPVGNAHVRIHESAELSARACATHILQELEETLKLQSQATIAISGGSTPKPLFASLAAADFDWSRIHFFWVDERCVPPADDRSNFKMAAETLLRPAAVPDGNVHRICGELPPEEGAAEYIQEIRRFFSLQEGQLPAFDLLHRGMGPDAHTASLFPGEPLILDRTNIAAHVWVEKLQMHRVTLLPGVLIAAKQTVLQVSGQEKASAVRNVLTASEDPMTYPCQIASRDSKATWFLDRAAASQL